MSDPAVLFDGVSKKFRLGERHDSLRDFLPTFVKGAVRRPPPGELERKEFWALRDVTFAVKGGEALGVIGPNGAGKSTVLKLLTRSSSRLAAAVRSAGASARSSRWQPAFIPI